MIASATAEASTRYSSRATASWIRSTMSFLVSSWSSMLRPDPCRGTVTTPPRAGASWPSRANRRPVLLYRCPARITRARSARLGRASIGSPPQLLAPACGRELREPHDPLRSRVERVAGRQHETVEAHPPHDLDRRRRDDPRALD